MIVRKSLKYLAFLFIATIFVNCSKTEDIPQDIEINDFVWGGMNAYYKWQSNVPDLSDRRFSTRPQLNSYLASFASPSDLFNAVLSYPNEYPKDPERVFSWIVEDYVALENSFQGIRTTTGIKGIVQPYENGSDSVYVYVRDVVTGSDADIKGVTRGMIFNKVNDQFLLQNNYQSLFENTSFSITVSDNYNAGNPVAGTTNIDLTKTQIQENPVKLVKVIEDSGKKIGYLLYNQFSRAHNKELNDAFATFKAQGITDLIIDLRYNGGGSVDTAIYLGSMITGQFNGELFAQQVWNEKVMANVTNERFKDYFTNEIDNGKTKTAINSVGMTSVYFIVTEDTASASELVINALKPYIDVKLVGNETVGKQVGSITLYDSDDYTKTGENFNTRHNWAIQPIVLEIKNKDGENNPNGYQPEVEIFEDPNNLGVLGDVSEPLLARTLQYILTRARGTSTRSFRPTKQRLWNTAMNNQDFNNMYVDVK